MFEYDYFDGDHFITFDILGIDEERNLVSVVISEQGKIKQDTFDLLGSESNPYFEFGRRFEKIHINQFKYL